MADNNISKKNSPLKIITKVIFVIFIIFAGVVILSLLGIPKQLRIFVVESGSMEPTIPTGSLIFDTPQDEYVVGDIITFNQPSDTNTTKSTPITHRIHSIEEEDGSKRFETKGDANQFPDSLTITQNGIIGKEFFFIPYAGYVIGFAKTQLGFVILILVPTIIIVLSELNNIKKEFGVIKDKRKVAKLNSNPE